MARVDMSSSDAGHTLGHVNGSDLLLSGLAGVIGAALWTLAALCSGGHRRRYDGLKGMVELRQRFDSTNAVHWITKVTPSGNRLEVSGRARHVMRATRASSARS